MAKPVQRAQITIYETAKGISSGYHLLILHAGKTLEDYSAGGHPLESQAPGESSTSTVKAWALSTAKDLFYEHFGREPTRHEIEVEVVQGEPELKD